MRKMSVRQFNLIKIFSSIVFALYLLSGCELTSGQEKDVQAIDTDFFNYTPYEDVWGVSFMEANKPFRYDKAAGASCCFMWHTKQTKPITLRVVWAVKFDEKKYKEGYDKFDDYTNPGNPPGVAWCEALTTIRQPYPVNPGKLILEVFPDGSVKSHFTAASDPQEALWPLPKEQYSNLPRLPEGQPCLKQISNPLYGLERPKHYE